MDDAFQAASTAVLEPPPKENVLKFAIIASLIIHLGFFVGIPRMAAIAPVGPILKPDETLTKVRIVDQPQQSTPEPPPDTSALSDKDHTAEKERISKTLPFPNPGGPIGQREPMESKMASLTPPPAPEELEKPKPAEPKEEIKEEPKEEKTVKPKPKPEETPKPQPTTKTRQRNKQQAKEVEPRRRKKPNPNNIDLSANAQEIRQAMSSSPGGPTSFYPDGEIEEAVVDINTKEDRFASYLLGLKHKIQGVWNYPRVAADAGIGGSLVVEFIIENTGTLKDVSLLDSSGHTILDEAAQKAIRTAAPYNRFPERMKAKKLRVRANFIYVTRNYFRSMM